jgi:hypothetical protein
MGNAAPIINAYAEEAKKHPDGGGELKAAMETRIAEIKQRSIVEKKQGCPQYRAELAWVGIANQEELDKKYLATIESYRNGSFFLERIGRYKEVDPALAWVLTDLRNNWIQEYEVKTAPEFMLVDMALTAYFHFMRMNEAINNILANIEWDQFALEVPQFHRKNGDRITDQRENKAIAEGLAHKLAEIMEPSLDKHQRMFTRSLKAMRDLKRGNVMLNIGNVGQVNFGNNQINVKKEEDAIKE